MKRISFFLICTAVMLSAAMPLFAQEEIHEKLLPLKDLLGRTFKGKLSEPDAKNEMWDVMRFERALNGNAVRMLHSINEGEYGGETIIFWDEAKQSLMYYYFTTAGFYTQGTMQMVSGSKWTAHETVNGPADGITEVRSTGEFFRDGQLKTTSEYLKEGTWVQGHSVSYDPVTRIDVKFH
ncbi:MAG: hypothetical protein WC824_01375 [Bacteroidota bacterium]|jgi:hypothetical protein